MNTPHVSVHFGVNRTQPRHEKPRFQGYDNPNIEKEFTGMRDRLLQDWLVSLHNEIGFGTVVGCFQYDYAVLTTEGTLAGRNCRPRTGR